MEMYSRNQLEAIYFTDLGYAAGEIISLETGKTQNDKMSQQLCSSLFTPLKIDIFLSTGRNKRLLFKQAQNWFLQQQRHASGALLTWEKASRTLEAVVQGAQTIPDHSFQLRWRERVGVMQQRIPFTEHNTSHQSCLLLVLSAAGNLPLGI